MLLSTCCGSLATLAVLVTVCIHLPLIAFLCVFVSTFPPFTGESVILNDDLM